MSPQEPLRWRQQQQDVEFGETTTVAATTATIATLAPSTSAAVSAPVLDSLEADTMYARRLASEASVSWL